VCRDSESKLISMMKANCFSDVFEGIKRVDRLCSLRDRVGKNTVQNVCREEYAGEMLGLHRVSILGCLHEYSKSMEHLCSNGGTLIYQPSCRLTLEEK
jgi:hypothetical protein